MPTNFSIGDREIGDNHPPLVIAEIGINHNGDLNIAKKLIKNAKVSYIAGDDDQAIMENYGSEPSVFVILKLHFSLPESKAFLRIASSPGSKT